MAWKPCKCDPVGENRSYQTNNYNSFNFQPITYQAIQLYMSGVAGDQIAEWYQIHRSSYRLLCTCNAIKKAIRPVFGDQATEKSDWDALVEPSFKDI